MEWYFFVSFLVDLLELTNLANIATWQLVNLGRLILEGVDQQIGFNLVERTSLTLSNNPVDSCYKMLVVQGLVSSSQNVSRQQEKLLLLGTQQLSLFFK